MGQIVHSPQPDPERHLVSRSAAAPPAPAEEGLDPRRLVEATYRRRRVLFVTFIMAVLAATAGALVLPRTYVARTSVLLLPDSNPEYLGGRSGSTTGLAQGHVDLLLEFVQSRNFMVPTLERLGLIDALTAGAGKKLSPEMKADLAIRAIRANISARPVSASAFEVTYRGSDPQWPVRILDTLVNGFIDVSSRTRASQAEASVAYLESQLDDYRARAERARGAMESFQTRHARILAQAPESTSSRLTRVEDGLVEARMSAVEAEMKISLIRRQMAETPASIVAESSRVPNPRVLSFQSRLSTAEAEHEALRARYTDEHPEVRAKAREVERLQQMVAQANAEPTATGSETTRVNPAYERLKDELLAAEGALQAARTREKQFSSMIGQARSVATSVPMARQQWESLQARARTQEALYNSLVERLEQAKLSSEMDARQNRAMYQLIDPARLVPTSEKRRRLAIILAGAGAGLLLGLTLVGLQEITDRRVHSVEDLERSVGLPVLAAIPLLPAMPHHIMARRRRWLLAAKVAVAVALVAGLFLLGTRTQTGSNFVRERVPVPLESAPSATTEGGAVTPVIAVPGAE